MTIQGICGCGKMEISLQHIHIRIGDRVILTEVCAIIVHMYATK